MDMPSSFPKDDPPLGLFSQNTPWDPDPSRQIASQKPRQRQRSVPMKVLVLGLSRTGTLSIRQALFRLGYFDVYHGGTFGKEDSRGAELWGRAISAKYENGKPFQEEDWNELLGNCMAVTDWPCCAFAEELVKTYPAAKVILSVRDSAEVWKHSMQKTVVATAEMTQVNSALARILRYFVKTRPTTSMYIRIIAHDRLLDIPEDGIQRYHSHIARIKELVPSERLLVFNVKQGWQPMCEFLGCEIPDVPFPRVNDQKTYIEAMEDQKKRLGAQAISSAVWTIGPLLAVVFSVALLARGRFQSSL